MVIGLGLCPFAEQVHKAGTVRYAVCASPETDDLLAALSEELLKLVATPRTECETTLLIAPGALPAFLDFNDFLSEVDECVESLNLAGTIQVVGFHPGYQFAGTAKDAPENYTNRSPHPLLHLLREESITEVSANADELLEIPKRNIRTLQRMGIEKILQRLKN